MTEKANRNLKFVYNPAVQKWEPETRITGTPTKGYASGVGGTNVTILQVAVGTFFALTDLIIANTSGSTSAITVTISDGNNAVFSYTITGPSVDIKFITPLVFQTSVVAVAIGGSVNVTVSGITAQ